MTDRRRFPRIAYVLYRWEWDQRQDTSSDGVKGTIRGSESLPRHQRSIYGILSGAIGDPTSTTRRQESSQ